MYATFLLKSENFRGNNAKLGDVRSSGLTTPPKMWLHPVDHQEVAIFGSETRVILTLCRTIELGNEFFYTY